MDPLGGLLVAGGHRKVQKPHRLSDVTLTTPETKNPVGAL